jgi:hypothetical protein
MIEHNGKTYDFEESPGKLIIGDREYRLQSLGPVADSINNIPVMLFFVYISDGGLSYMTTKTNKFTGKMVLDRSYDTYKGSRVIVSSPWHIVEETKQVLVQVSRHDVEEPTQLDEREWDELFMATDIAVNDRLDSLSKRVN